MSTLSTSSRDVGEAGAPWRAARLAVLGSPIGHSKSPALHAAAHRALGLEDRSYERIEVPAGGLARFLAERGSGWRGLSVTMPLKGEALAAADEASELARRTGAANTLVFATPEPDARIVADNTDPHGIVAALEEAGVPAASTIEVLGAGATAHSALAAAARLGARHARVLARSAERAAPALRLARELGLGAEYAEFARWGEAAAPDLVLSTLPVAASEHLAPPADRVERSALFDVVYAPWPSPLAGRWAAGGRPVASGEAMLLHQAVEQARRFAGLPEGWDGPERERVVEAMRAALAG